MRGMRAVVLILVAAALACSDPPGFDPANWKFIRAVPLRRAAVGGWQEACAYLTFVDAREFIPKSEIRCGIKVGMPLVAEANGPISAEFAAKLTAAIATEASGATIHSRPTWAGEDYCIALREKMRELFPGNLGARVNEC